MTIYNDYEPKTIKLRAITPKGKEISVNAFLSPSEEEIIVDNGYDRKSVKYQFSTHIRCQICGKICDKNQIYYKDSKYICYECNEALNYSNYLKLPVKNLEFPFFINDKIIFEREDLESYIDYYEGKDFSKEFIYPAIRIKFNFDLFSHIQDNIDNNISNDDYDINVNDFSPKIFEEISNMEKRINIILQENIPEYYEADLEHRIIIPEFSSQ